MLREIANDKITPKKTDRKVENDLYENDLEYAKEKDNKYAYRMLEKIEWLDADRLLVATGNGLRIFDTRTESYTQNYFKTKERWEILKTMQIQKHTLEGLVDDNDATKI